MRKQIISKRKTKKNKNNKIIKGGSFLDAIGSVVQTRKNYTTPMTSFSKILNPASIEHRFSQPSNQYFQITYNYNTPKQLNINTNRNKPIPSSSVETEPHIIIGNMNRYLITLIDGQPYNKLLWIAEFANNSKQKTILSYQSPIPFAMEKHSYTIQIYEYPNSVQPFTVLDINTQKRKQEYRNFITYLSNPQNTTQIKLIMSFPMNIYKDTSSGISLFNLVSTKKKIKPITRINTKEKKTNYAKFATHS